jgi:deoxyribodipyrimidine photolyase-related protein
VINVEQIRCQINVTISSGDQLNSNHSWFKAADDSVTYVMMEVRTETDYASHHIQK